MLADVTDSHLEKLAALLPAAAFGADVKSYTEDPRRIIHGHGAAVLRPGTTEEIAAIVRFAGQNRLPVIPYGGGTGLVGGQVSDATPKPLILSLERMNRIRGVIAAENTLIAEAGATLAEVQQAAQEADRLFPLSLASEGTARIGGNLSTNAGGVQVLRYGNARDLCLGLEAVLPSGEVWHGLKRLRKDNTGYDLRNLLIGAEGTLGVITAASLRLYPISESIATALISVKGPAAALNLLSMGQGQLGAGLTAFELIDGTGLDFLRETGLPGSDLLKPRPDWSVLVEVALPADMAAGDHLNTLFETAHAAGIASDGIVAQSEGQRKALWHMRESLPEANRRVAAVASHDISVPLGSVPDMIERGNAMIARLGDFRTNVFGHLGDGNLHFNVFPPKGAAREDFIGFGPQITASIHDLVADLDGSISAEHGIGRHKVKELERLGDPVKLTAMRAIKSALDPQGIMNPGAVLTAG